MLLNNIYKKNIGEYFSENDQNLISNLTVAVIGAGGVGGELIVLLGRLGVQKFIIFDGDDFCISNLNRQALCFQSTLNKNKAIVAKNYLLEINPLIKVFAYPTYFSNTVEDYEKIKQADIIFFAADNEKNFSDLITITRKLIVEDEKTVIFSSVTILGVNTVVLTKESVDLFDKITHNALSSTSKKSISQLGYMTTIAAAQSVDAFVKEICNKDNKLKDQSLVYNIYHNQLHRFDKYKQIY